MLSANSVTASWYSQMGDECINRIMRNIIYMYICIYIHSSSHMSVSTAVPMYLLSLCIENHEFILIPLIST